MYTDEESVRYDLELWEHLQKDKAVIFENGRGLLTSQEPFQIVHFLHLYCLTINYLFQTVYNVLVEYSIDRAVASICLGAEGLLVKFFFKMHYLLWRGIDLTIFLVFRQGDIDAAKSGENHMEEAPWVYVDDSPTSHADMNFGHIFVCSYLS